MEVLNSMGVVASLSLKSRVGKEKSSHTNELSYLLTLERRWRWSIYSLSHEGVSGRGIQGQRPAAAYRQGGSTGHISASTASFGR